jgi:hypothetical protein
MREKFLFIGRYEKNIPDNVFDKHLSYFSFSARIYLAQRQYGYPINRDNVTLNLSPEAPKQLSAD